MRRVALLRAVTSRLSRQLLLSHLAVAFLTLSLVVATYGAIALFTRGDELLRQTPYDPDFAQGTRLLGELLFPHVQHERDEPGSLQMLLARLVASSVPGSGPLGGTVNEGTGIVVVAPDGSVLAAVPTRPDSLAAVEPVEWREALTVALEGSRDLSPNGPLLRSAQAGAILVSAYPILAPDGTVVGTVGLRTQPLATVPASGWARLASLVVGLSLVVADFLLTAAIPAAIVSTLASLLVTRRIRAQLRELEAATEAIVRGELGRRVRVLSQDELGRLAERFNLLTEALERLEEQRRRFFANVAHDLRTPLALIRAQAETLLSRIRSDVAEERTGLERIVHETESLGRLVEDLFTLARLDERGLPLQLGAVDLGALLPDVVESIRPLARRAGHITLLCEVARDCPAVRADPVRLRQILLNLLHNALRHTPEGGVVAVRAVPGREMVTVAVCDTGPGLPLDVLDEPFRRYHASSDPSRGSGLGLAVARQLVEAQGGSIRVESVPGHGTVVSFTLPLAGARAVTDGESIAGALSP